MRDLQRRLTAAGHLAGPLAEPGYFCAQTSSSVRAFQAARGLAVDGVCGEYTWAGLVEASWCLGDRPLYLTAPNIRGDDVADLQSHLGRLGFDCGKVDGIFGPLAAEAVRDFQANCGLVADGVCGVDTVQVMVRVARQSGSGPGVATMRERDRLEFRTATMSGLRVVVGRFGALSGLTRTVTRSLARHGAVVLIADAPDARAQAELANSFGADVYLGFEAVGDGANRVSFYAVPEFTSAGGRSLATHLVHGLAAVAGLAAPSLQGMRLQVLRETRMPAVLTSFGDVRDGRDLGADIGKAVVSSLAAWSGDPQPLR